MFSCTASENIVRSSLYKNKFIIIIIIIIIIIVEREIPRAQKSCMLYSKIFN